MNRYILLILIPCFITINQSCTKQSFEVGDIFFQDLDCGPPCEAIEAVTSGYQGAQLSHCAIITHIGSSEYDTILTEAIGATVTDITLHDFLNRSNKVLVGRLKEEYQYMIPDAITHIQTNLNGKPYDYIFDSTDDTYYCSEIIYEGLKTADDTQELFALNPMTFNEPGTESPFIHWVDYYQELGHPIPEGKLGLNPGGMSQSPAIAIVYVYEKPTGMQE
ncbi:MAG: YiiX/YebB-like N1pC/P60 family cysteine hydrolase [Candidatus Marinimicrobia bacterium]|nr:YiiX/YebB-like N1pC/P60 family cysteine hydrolase [Candidatus Neomarinimicrobiota bacterium]